MFDFTVHIDHLREIITNTGNEILKYYNSTESLGIEKKEDNTPVTLADFAAHDIVSKGLKKLTPKIPILSEESVKSSFEHRREWSQYWLVDPLDGTRDFINGKEEFTVNIAFIENHKAIFGMIYVPISKRTYFAFKGSSAFKCKENHAPHDIHCKQYQGEPLRIAVSRYNKVEKLKEFLSEYSEYEIIHAGSALKFCLIAEGSADVYPRLGPTCEWDTAAGQIIVEQAGGLVMDFQREPLRYNQKENLLNPNFIVISDSNLIDERMQKILDRFN